MNSVKIKYNSIFFVGISGCSMSAIATLCRKLGVTVYGHDKQANKYLNAIEADGVTVGESNEAVFEAKRRLSLCQAVVYSAAVPQNNELLVYARYCTIPTIERGAFLGYLADLFPVTAAVAGTHGKTGVTALLTEMLIDADVPFCAQIGGIMRRTESNYLLTGTRLFVTEACEYRNSFLSLNPTVAVITNVDEDHPDCFACKSATDTAFTEFGRRVKSSGTLICALDERLLPVINATTAKRVVLITRSPATQRKYAFYKGLTCAKEITVLYSQNEYTLDGYTHFSLMENGRFLCETVLNAVGAHNVTNCLCALAAARELGVTIDKIVGTAARFYGTRRRFEEICRLNESVIISDYAHHPSEIAAALDTATRLYPMRRITAIFEPHTYSRTASLLPRFSLCFAGADSVAILPTFAARETPDKGADAKTLFKAICHKNKRFLSGYDEAETYVKEQSKGGGVILLLGAGSIEKLGDRLPTT